MEVLSRRILWANADKLSPDYVDRGVLPSFMA